MTILTNYAKSFLGLCAKMMYLFNCLWENIRKAMQGYDVTRYDVKEP